MESACVYNGELGQCLLGGGGGREEGLGQRSATAEVNGTTCLRKLSLSSRCVDTHLFDSCPNSSKVGKSTGTVLSFTLES